MSKNNDNPSNPHDHAPPKRDAVCIDNYDTADQADEFISSLPSMSEADLRAIVGQVRERNPVRLRIKQAALEELDRRINTLREEKNALEVEYVGSSFKAHVPWRPCGKQWASFGFMALLMLSLGVFGGHRVTVTTSADASAQTILIAPEFAESLHESGSYWTLTDKERAEVDRARMEGER